MSDIGVAADPTRGHARRKGPRGRWELLVDDTWVPEEQLQAWETTQRVGSQAAAARELGVPTSTLHSRLDAYMGATGMSGPRPAAPGARRAGGRKPHHTRVVEPPPPSVVDGPEASDPVTPTAGSEAPSAAGRAAQADPTTPTAAEDQEQARGPGALIHPRRDRDIDRIALPSDLAADLLLDGLFGFLPEPGTAWPWEGRERWSTLARAIFAIVYQEDER